MPLPTCSLPLYLLAPYLRPDIVAATYSEPPSTDKRPLRPIGVASSFRPGFPDNVASGRRRRQNDVSHSPSRNHLLRAVARRLRKSGLGSDAILGGDRLLPAYRWLQSALQVPFCSMFRFGMQYCSRFGRQGRCMSVADDYVCKLADGFVGKLADDPVGVLADAPRSVLMGD